MNYLKQLLHEFHINESESSNSSDNSPQESGEFQVIEIDECLTVEDNRQNIDKVRFSVSCNQATPKSTQCQTLKQVKIKSYQQKDSGQDKNCLQKLSKQYTLIQFDPQEPDKHISNGSASTIQMDEYYMIVSTEQLTKKFITQQQWIAFYKKIKEFNEQQIQQINSSISCSVANFESQRKKSRISLNLKQLNSILEIKSDEIQRRQEYWNQIAVTPLNIKFKYTELANKKDPKKLQQNVNKMMDNLAPVILFDIADKKYKPIENVQDQLQKWKTFLIKVLTFYGANDKQIGYSKGLQYIALGLLVSKPFGQSKLDKCESQNDFLTKQTPEALSPTSSQSCEYKEFQMHFKYLLFTKQLRNMYFPGTPKLYQQIQLLIELMKTEVPQLYLKLQEMKVDFIKLFINYYKTFLLYKIKNPEVIRKIMELLLIYGIDIVRILLTRIMSRNQKKIFQMVTQQIQLLRYLAESLVQDYFGCSDTQEVIAKFKQLFVLDIIN